MTDSVDPTSHVARGTRCETEWLECVGCRTRFDILAVRYRCDCGELLSVERETGWSRRIGPADFDARLASRETIDRSGVWRFREGVMSIAREAIVTHPEGSTRLYASPALSSWADVGELRFKHEGENPTGSFKDRGMTVATTHAARIGARAVACASTGNTSASLAAYAAAAGMRAVVFVPAGKIAMGKLAQTLAYGATVLAIRGDFDAAMALVSEAAAKLDLYLLNSINPFRIEGQKTIAWEMLQDLSWHAPDWVVLPAGNLGNTSAIGKALLEAHEAGWISKLPRVASIQASGANPFYQGFSAGFRARFRVQAETVASAIRIGDPVSWEKARKVIELTNGVVAEVTDAEILEAKRAIDRAGIGCEPASAASLAGARNLRNAGVIAGGESVVCILTGNILKDPEIILKDPAVFEGQVVEIDADIREVEKALTK